MHEDGFFAPVTLNQEFFELTKLQGTWMLIFAFKNLGAMPEALAELLSTFQ